MNDIVKQQMKITAMEKKLQQEKEKLRLLQNT
ncbi:hypothetical protein [Psychrobacillus phage Perkons]|nr:hypothetical protein [Psychrobacillus phage Perkons]